MRAMVMRLGTRVSGFLAMGGQNRNGGRGSRGAAKMSLVGYPS
jgi:hypothetical protein